MEAAAEFLHGKQKPVLLIGSKLRAAGAEKAAVELADALGCSVAVMAAAKSFFPEDHPQFAGIYWGEVAPPARARSWTGPTPCCVSGPSSMTISTVGWTAMSQRARGTSRRHDQCANGWARFQSNPSA